MIVDAHCHLDAYGDEELPAVLADARTAGAELIITVGMDLPTSSRGAAIAAREEMVFAAVGLHPWMVQDHPEGAPVVELEALVRRGNVVAIGEIGLDFVGNSWLDLSYEDSALRRAQEVVFRDQLRLAKRLELPVILHSRGAHATTTHILREERIESVGGCIQFSEGTTDDVQAYVALGFGFTVGSSVTFSDGADAWHATVREIPVEALLLESDAPWLPYFGHASGRSTPADVVTIGEAVARVRGANPVDVFSAVARNVRRILPGVATTY